MPQAGGGSQMWSCRGSRAPSMTSYKEEFWFYLWCSGEPLKVFKQRHGTTWSASWKRSLWQLRMETVPFTQQCGWRIALGLVWSDSGYCEMLFYQSWDCVISIPDLFSVVWNLLIPLCATKMSSINLYHKLRCAKIINFFSIAETLARNPVILEFPYFLHPCPAATPFPAMPGTSSWLVLLGPQKCITHSLTWLCLH
jgi:hypothetical protein